MKVNNKNCKKDDVVVIGQNDKLGAPEFSPILSVLVDVPIVILALQYLIPSNMLTSFMHLLCITILVVITYFSHLS